MEIFLAVAVLASTSGAAVNVSGEGLAVGSKPMRHQDCLDVVMSWLQEGFNPVVDSERASLGVDWEFLDKALASAGCHPGGDLRTELWRVLDEGTGSSADFGTQQYFTKFRRCQHLSPDHFAHHETRSHEVGRPHDEFHHVVEKRYVIRLCPCPSRNNSTRCDCEDLALCSAVINVGGKGPFVWCQQHKSHYHGDWKEEHAGVPATGTIPVMGESKREFRLAQEFPAPQVDCMSATLSGTVPSCTPIVDYDRVKVVLHRVHGGERNICSNHTAVHNADAANVFISALIRKNLTHGGFQIDVSNLTPDANYCVTIELYGHPYCHLPLVVGNVGNEVYRQPAVCRTHNVETPLKTTKECSSPASVMGFRGSLNTGGMTTVIVCVVCVAICILTVTVAFSRLIIRRRDKSKSGVITSNLYLATPNTKNEDVEVENAANSPAFDVFLIYLSDSPESNANNATLREWLGSLDMVNEVLDLSDPDRQEEILSRQEEWVTTVMAKLNLRVVTVVSDKLKTLRNRSSWRPREHNCGAASSLTSLSDTDACTSPAADASSSATKPPAPGASDEERLGLLQNCEGGEQVRKATCTETEAVGNDALAELRIFALRQAVAHLRGQYGRLMLVRHEIGTNMGKGENMGDGGGNCSDVEDLTPLRRPLVLPQQADELVRWLMPHKDPTENYNRFKATYVNRLSRVCDATETDA